MANLPGDSAELLGLMELREYLELQFAKQAQLLAEIRSDMKSMSLAPHAPSFSESRPTESTLGYYPRTRSTTFSLFGHFEEQAKANAGAPLKPAAELVESVDFNETSECESHHSYHGPLRGRLGTQDSAARRVSMVDPEMIRQHIEAHDLRNLRLVRAMSSLGSVSLRTRAREAVQSGPFNALILFLIVVNAILLGVEIDVSSQLGEDEIPSWFMVVNTAIVGIFVLEIILKLIAMGCHDFWRGPQAGWNMFDVVIVALSTVEVLIDLFATTVASNLWGADTWSFMRTLRLARALRGLRFFRMIRYFSALRALILSIISTMSSLLWTLVLLFILFYSFSVIIMQMVSDYCRYLAVVSRSDTNATPECPDELHLHWPSVLESMLTLLYCITDGISWEVALNPLRQVSLLAVGVLIFYIIISVFTILNVVTGVFVNTAIERASADKDIASLKALQRRTEQMKELQQAFEEIDEGQTNEVRMQDIEKAASLDRLGACMEALDISAEDVKTLFTLIDTDNSGAVDLEEFVSGCMQLHGPAKSLQIAKMSYENKRIKEAIQTIGYQVFEVNRKLSSLRSSGAAVSSTSLHQLRE
ncbi:Scn11a [Symbiodinium natans]|uniref:Scn11a protein n=1 Tax=Symbiodinium natans TaxID=878477 RepID=A0A812S4E9_9DINO|nr:Scn11a [Symbiodinium natans]